MPSLLYRRDNGCPRNDTRSTCPANNKYWIPTDFNITPLHESSFISHYWNSYESFFCSLPFSSRSRSCVFLFLFFSSLFPSFLPSFLLPSPFVVLFISTARLPLEPSTSPKSCDRERFRRFLVKFLRPAVFATIAVRRSAGTGTGIGGQAEAGSVSSFRIA